MTDEKPIYAQINRKVWNTNRFRSLSPEARELFFYLTTCPHGNMLGIFVLRPGYALDDLQWGTNPKRFTKHLQELIDKQLFKYDFKNEVILDMEQIIKHPPENPNQVKWAIKIISSLPKTPLFQDVKLLCERLNKPFLKPFIEGLVKPETETITETITETEERDADKPPAPQGKFIKPTINEIESYCIERNNGINAETFFNHYQSNGWMIGKNKMKDWKAAIRTWEQRDNQTKQEEKPWYEKSSIRS